jgi:hypothetical protein
VLCMVLSSVLRIRYGMGIGLGGLVGWFVQSISSWLGARVGG